MKQVELVEATTNDVDELHAMQVEAFMPLYEIYHDDMSPVNETKERILWKITEDISHFYFIVFEGKKVGAVRAIRDRSLDDDFFVWLREDIDGEADAFDDAWNERQPVFRYIPSMMVFRPFRDGWPQFRRRDSIA